MPALPAQQLSRSERRLGMVDGIELATLLGGIGSTFDRAIWLHKARQMLTNDFKMEVEKDLTGRETEP